MASIAQNSLLSFFNVTEFVELFSTFLNSYNSSWSLTMPRHPKPAQPAVDEESEDLSSCSSEPEMIFDHEVRLDLQSGFCCMCFRAFSAAVPPRRQNGCLCLTCNKLGRQMCENTFKDQSVHIPMYLLVSTKSASC